MRTMTLESSAVTAQPFRHYASAFFALMYFYESSKAKIDDEGEVELMIQLSGTVDGKAEK